MKSNRKSQRIYSFNQKANRFTRHVFTARSEIAEAYHLRRLGPDCVERFWNEDFAASYDDLRPYLKSLFRERLFCPPGCTQYKSVPFTAESATQANMYVLNPHEALQGEAGFLASKNYVAMHQEMVDELREAASHLEKLRRAPVLRATQSQSDVKELRGKIYEHHYPKSGVFVDKFLTIKDLEEKLGWSQPKVSKQIKVLFKNVSGGGMKAYKEFFREELDADGFLTFFDDKRLGVDKIWEDRRPTDDDDDDYVDRI